MSDSSQHVSKRRGRELLRTTAVATLIVGFAIASCSPASAIGRSGEAFRYYADPNMTQLVGGSRSGCGGQHSWGTTGPFVLITSWDCEMGSSSMSEQCFLYGFLNGQYGWQQVACPLYDPGVRYCITWEGGIEPCDW